MYMNAQHYSIINIINNREFSQYIYFLNNFIVLCFLLSSYSCGCCKVPLYSHPRSGELGTQKLKSHLVRTQSLNVLPFKPGVGQYIAIHATLIAREFSLAYFYPSSPFTCIFSKTSPNFFLCWPAE